MSAGELPAGAEAGWEMLADGVVVVDAERRVRFANSAAGRILGVESPSLLDRSLEDAVALSDGQGRSWWSCSDPWEGLRSRTRQVEVTLTTTSGLPVLVTANYVRGADRGLEWLVVSLRDARARQREEKRSANLISTVAHELRSPLTSVKGFTATLLKKWERFSDEQKILMLETINHDADRVTRLITDLLDVSRIDAGRLELKKRVVDIEKIVSHVVEGRKVSEEETGRFELTVAGEMPEMWGDPDKLTQVIANLVENAVRHGAGQVEITLRGHEEGCTLTIEDEGEGISEEAAKRVFGRFYRGDRRGGTGLGLYIVKGLTEAHGGKVTLGRSRSGGAAFTIELPLGTPAFM